MNLKQLFKAYKEKRIKKISNMLFEVDDKIVKIHIKQGRRYLTCSCQNHARFPNESFCSHKILVINYPILEYFNKKIKGIISFLELNKGLKKNKLSDKEVISMIKDII